MASELAGEWTYRYPAAAHAWAVTEAAVGDRIGADAADVETSAAPRAPEPSSREARAAGIAVPDPRLASAGGLAGVASRPRSRE
jgi:hypothetical protein